MLSRRTFQFWSGVLISFFCGALIILAYVSRRPLCIDSKIVERIDRISEAGTRTAYRCSLGKHVPYDGSLEQITQRFGQRLMPLERFLEYLGGPSKRVSITLLNSPETYFKVRGQQIYATENLLKAPGQLEKAVLKIWLRDRVRDTHFENSLAEEVLSDFLWASVKGRLDIYDPVNQRNLAQVPPTHWPDVLKNSYELCDSPWWPVKSAPICQVLRGQSGADPQIDFDSLRALLSQAMIDAYEEIPAENKITFLQEFAKNLSGFQDPEGAPVAQRNYLQAQQVMKKWISGLRALNGNFGTLFAGALARHGYHDLLVTVRFNALVIFDSVSKENQGLLEKSLFPLESTRFIGYKNGDQVMFSSQGGVTIPMSEIGSWTADKIIWAGCGSPQTQKLEEMSSKSERLLFLDLCRPVARLDVAPYITADAEAFAAGNKDVNFIEFHLPSLKLAMEKVEAQGASDPNLLVELLKQSSDGKDKQASFLTEALGWQKPIYSSSIKAYRSQSAIEAINWYRVN
jgi:hypothetical protein